MFRPAFYSIIVAATVLAGASQAQTASQFAPAGKETAVTYADLDLSREAGAQILIQRMRAAAAKVCGPAPDLRQMEMHRVYVACVNDTLQRSVASVNAPVVTSLYQGLATTLARD